MARKRRFSMEPFGATVESLMNEIGVTYRELGAKTGLSAGYLNHLVHGNRPVPSNDVRYGLAASVWTRDIGRALNAARKLQFGAVWVNDHLLPIASELPHGGYKQSGYGKDMSIYSMEEYTQLKHVAIKID